MSVLGWDCRGGALLAAHGRGRRGPRPGRHAGFGPFFGPGGFSRGPRARRGDVRAAALLLLAEGPLNGYQVMQEIDARSDGVWRPSPGSVYPALSQLEDEGLVRVDASGDQRRYALTDSGRAHVEAHREEWGVPWEQMTGAVDDEVGALFRELRRVGMAAAQIGHLGSSEQIDRARSALAEARRALYALLGEDEDEPT
jgi:DNA-binding PadR family transcriptional regulator